MVSSLSNLFEVILMIPHVIQDRTYYYGLYIIFEMRWFLIIISSSNRLAYGSFRPLDLLCGLPPKFCQNNTSSSLIFARSSLAIYATTDKAFLGIMSTTEPSSILTRPPGSQNYRQHLASLPQSQALTPILTTTPSMRYAFRFGTVANT